MEKDYNEAPPSNGTSMPADAVIYTGRDRLLLPMAWLAGYLLVETLFYTQHRGLSFALLGLALLAATAWYLPVRGKSLVLFAPVALIFLAPALFSLPEWLLRVDVAALSALFSAACLICAGNRRYPATRPVFLLDLMVSCIVLPFARAGRAFGALRSTKVRRALPFIAGFAVAAPVLGIIVFLLSSADPVFRGVARRVAEAMSYGDWAVVLLRLLIGLVPALLLYSWLYSLRSGNMADASPAVLPKRDGSVNRAYLLGGLIPLSALYAMFAVIQFTYLFGHLDAGVTYSEYARRGFFELTFVAALNMLLAQLSIYLMKGRGSGEGRPVRFFSLLIMCETAVMLASAVYRMLLYIGAYGLTTLRVLTLTAEAGIAVLTVCCAVKSLKPEFRTFPWFCGVFVSGLLLCNFMNINAIIRTYNYSAYASGRLENFDVAYYEELAPFKREALDWRSWNLESVLSDEP